MMRIQGGGHIFASERVDLGRHGRRAFLERIQVLAVFTNVRFDLLERVRYDAINGVQSRGYLDDSFLLPKAVRNYRNFDPRIVGRHSEIYKSFRVTVQQWRISL